MLTEQTHVEPNWAVLPGAILDGGYQLEELLEADPSQAAFRVRVLGDRSIEAVATFFRAPAESGEEQIEIWTAMKELRSANLNAPLASGRREVDGNGVVYVVMRRPDERLSAVLTDRALTPEEARELFLSVSAGLAKLHENGLVHGCVAPEEVLAIGDSIVLSSECVRRAETGPLIDLPVARYLAPESAGTNATAQADVWCLGATLFETLTQKRCTADSSEQAASLPAPSNAIVQRCLEADPQKRAGLAELAEIQKNRIVSAPMEQPTQPKAEAKPVAAPVAEATAPLAAAAAASAAVAGAAASPVAVRPVAPQPPPAASTVQQQASSAASGRTTSPLLQRDQPDVSRLRDRRDRGFEPETQSSRIWLYAIGALVVLLVIIWAAKPSKHTQAAAVANNTGATQTAPPVPQKAWETKTLAPEHTAASNVPAPRNAAVETHKGKAEAPTVNGPVWRVVVYTFNKPEDAEKKAHTVNQKHHGLNAQVFSPNAHGGPYLVTLGGRLTRQDAARLRQRAIGQGLPHDSYIQNYQQ